jgi:hypothetical protein
MPKSAGIALALSVATIIWSRQAHARTEAAIQPDPAVEREVRSVRIWGACGVLVPIVAAMVVEDATGANDHAVSTKVNIARVALWSTGGLWGTSVAYYRAGLPLYATLSGLGKTALVAGGLLLDTQVLFRSRGDDQEGFEGMPLFTLLGLGGVIGWDLYDYFRLGKVVREHARAQASPVAAVDMAAVPLPGGGLLGLSGRF